MLELDVPVPLPGSPHALSGTLTLHSRDADAGPPSRSETEGKPIAVFVHGAMSHKNALMFKPLARGLPIDTFRFDAL